MTEHDAAFYATGHTQEATPSRQARGRDEFEAAYAYAIKSRTHLWVAVIQHRATDVLLDSIDGIPDSLPLLDVDTLLGPPLVGCYVCEEAYEPRLRRRACKGEPREGARP